MPENPSSVSSRVLASLSSPHLNPWTTSRDSVPEFPMSRLRTTRRRKPHRHRTTRQVPEFRLLYCRTCRDRFSEHKGTPLYAPFAADKVTSILEHIHEGCRVLKTVRLVKVHPDTVSRYGRAGGDHSRTAHDEVVAHSPETRRCRWMRSGRSSTRRGRTATEDDPEDEPPGGLLGISWPSTRYVVHHITGLLWPSQLCGADSVYSYRLAAVPF